VTVPLDVVIEIGPEVAPTGTTATIWVVAALLTVAAVVLNATVLLAVEELKSDPVIVTDVPGGPLNGLKLVMLGPRAIPPPPELLLPPPPPQPPSAINALSSGMKTKRRRIFLVRGMRMTMLLNIYCTA
jgi:hypothetical protein